MYPILQRFFQMTKLNWNSGTPYLLVSNVQMNLSICNKVQVWSSPGLKDLEELPMAKSNPATQCLKWINRKSPTMAIILKLSIKSDILRSDASKAEGRTMSVTMGSRFIYLKAYFTHFLLFLLLLIPLQWCCFAVLCFN